MKHLCCEHCECAACLTVVGGTVTIEDGELTYADLDLECERHGLQGSFENFGDVVDADGAVLTVDEPVAATGGVGR